MISAFLTILQGNFKESYMAAFYDYFNEQKYADAVKNVSLLIFVDSSGTCSPATITFTLPAFALSRATYSHLLF